MWHHVGLVRTDVSEEHIIIFCPEDGEYTFLRNVGPNRTHTVPHPRKLHSSVLHKSAITVLILKGRI
jgi:hypothetical protein